MCVGRFGLGFTYDAIWFLHVTCSYIFHAYVPFLFLLSIMCCNVFWFFFPSLSLSRIDCAWHANSTNLLRLRTLFVVLGFLLLIFPLFTFGSVMKKPERTFHKTSNDAAFIRNAKSFCRTFPTLLSLPSFGLGVGLLSMWVLWDVLLWLYRSFTPIYIVSIPLCHCLLCSFEVHVS